MVQEGEVHSIAIKNKYNGMPIVPTELDYKNNILHKKKIWKKRSWRHNATIILIGHTNTGKLIKQNFITNKELNFLIFKWWFYRAKSHKSIIALI